MPNISDIARPLKIGSSRMKKAPIIAASAVSMIGFARTADAWITASSSAWPARCWSRMKSTSSIEFRTMMPASAIMPIIEVRPKQRVSRHDADDRQRDRRHDDQRQQVGPELRDDQQVYKNQADRVGESHVAERFVGDLPFAVPLHREVVRVLRLADVTLLDGCTGVRDFVDLARQLEHAV